MDTPIINNQGNAPMSHKGGKGIVVAIIIVVAAALVLWFVMSKGTMAPTENQVSNDAVTDSLNTQSNSDELNAIDADLNATDIDSIDR